MFRSPQCCLIHINRFWPFPCSILLDILEELTDLLMYRDCLRITDESKMLLCSGYCYIESFMIPVIFR